MQLIKNNIELDYDFYNNEAERIIEYIKKYFGNDIIFLSKTPNLPDQPERNNKISARVEVLIKDEFYITFALGTSCFTFYISFEDPNISPDISTGIPDILIFEKYEDYRKLTFHPNNQNIHLMLDKLNWFIKYILSEKVIYPNYSYYKIGMLKVCEINGWDPKKRIKE